MSMAVGTTDDENNASGKNVEDNETSEERTLAEKIFQTVCLIATWMALSSYAELYGPTLIDLKLKLHTDYESVSVAVSGRSVGLFPGSIIGGFLVDKFPRYCHVMIAVVLNIAAAATAAIPWAPTSTVVWVLCFTCGFMEAVLNIAGTRILFDVWKEKSTSPLMLMHLGYGIGSLIVPVYVNPFLAVEKNSNDIDSVINGTNNTAITTSTVVTTLGSVSTTVKHYYENSSRIEYAYAISASYVVFISLLFYVNQIRELRQRVNPKPEEDPNHDQTKATSDDQNEKKKDKTLKQMINPATCAKGRFWYGFEILLLIFIYFANIAGGGTFISVFLRTFAVDQLRMDNDSSTLLNTCYWISFSVGRLVMSFLAKCLSVRVLIIVQSAGMAIPAILMAIFSADNALSFWILILTYGFFVAATWPAGIAWTDYHIELTGLGMTLQFLGASIGGICHMRLIGYIYDKYGPTMYLYQGLAFCVFQFVLSVLLNIIGSQHGSRFVEDNVQTEDIEIIGDKDTKTRVTEKL